MSEVRPTVRVPRPIAENCPGLTWRPWGKEGWEARWRPRADLIVRGYLPTPIRLWNGTELSEADHTAMSERCKSLQSDMLLWGRGGLDNLFQWGRDQPAVYDPDGNIYFITDGEAIKIGYSTAPEVRMANLQGAHYRELRIMFAMPGKVDDEAALHEKFRRLWIRGEWFRSERELLDFIEEKRSTR